MQYTIYCPACQQQLTVNPGWEGQQVNCPLCAAPFTMPNAPAPFVVAESKEAKQPETVKPPLQLWNPSAAANWSVVFGPVFGTFIHYLNWVSLGELDRAQNARKWCKASILVSALIWWNVNYDTNSDLALSASLAFLGVWYFSAAKAQINHIKLRLNGVYNRRSWLKPIGIGSACLLTLLDIPEFSDLQQQSAARIYELSPEEAIKEAKKHVVGTWTYTGPDYKFIEMESRMHGLPAFRETNGWLKWVVSEDGTMVAYKTRPTANDWGKGIKTKWTIQTGKFTNTGRRYYDFMPETVDFRFGERVLITREGQLEYKLEGNQAIIMERGDKFPFSR